MTKKEMLLSPVINNDVKRLIICTFAAIKGGVGKTTLTFNFGEWLALLGYRVLLIDNDHQCNLSQTYGVYTHKNTVANIFTKTGKVDIHNVKENVYLIAGYMKLDKVEKELENRANKDMLLYMWLEDNYESLNIDQYDFILIDCHPDFATATRNAIAISHSIISPIIPSEHGYNAKFNLEERLNDFRSEVVDYRTRESYITAELMYVANMIKHNTNSSKELIRVLENESNIIATIPHREIFNRTTLDKFSIAEMMDDKVIYKENKEFFATMELQFKNMLTALIAVK